MRPLLPKSFLPKSLLPRSLLAQVALLSVAAMVLGQIASFWLFTAERGAIIRADQRAMAVEHAVRLARLVDGAPVPVRGELVEAATSRALRFVLSPDPAVPEGRSDIAVDWPGARAQEAWDTSHHGHGPPAPMRWLRDYGIAPAEPRLSLPLADGLWLNAAARLERPGMHLPPQALASTLLTLLLLLGALWLGLKRITGPLRKLAQAADAFGLGAEPPPLPRGGPREVRALAEALARMHERLYKMIGERTRMLAALGHDLRSPITALRLRAEMVEDDEIRERMALILNEMQEMTEATLAFARGVSVAEPLEPVDLNGLLADLAAELSASGPPVTLVVSAPHVLPLRRMALRRALRNLLENAQRYGAGATVGISPAGTETFVTIDDAGPGIPEADLERVFDPFERLETSRSRETGGAGLGLPIARAILRAHGGEVSLSNRPDGGLRATVRLPAANQAAKARANASREP
ncbi:sensor histidine kinase [Xanthobacter flavus]|uniref:sensor histidine kinase n=1 Tax=Xanthobacter flavus TaxID=281 RepID=UPI001AE4FC21|nr:ATP-binding protein [Xanthobacter flavus]MBP2150878.1 signal transduction histidine kinase [Xanthobacter flavus]